MAIQTKRYGQEDSAVSTATTAAAIEPAASALSALVPYYFIAVAAGVTVWFITKWLSKKGDR